MYTVEQKVKICNLYNLTQSVKQTQSFRISEGLHPRKAPYKITIHRIVNKFKKRAQFITRNTAGKLVKEPQKKNRKSFRFGGTQPEKKILPKAVPERQTQLHYNMAHHERKP